MEHQQDPQGKHLIVEDEPLLSMDMEASLAEVDCEIGGPARTIESKAADRRRGLVRLLMPIWRANLSTSLPLP